MEDKQWQTKPKPKNSNMYKRNKEHMINYGNAKILNPQVIDIDSFKAYKYSRTLIEIYKFTLEKPLFPLTNKKGNLDL